MPDRAISRTEYHQTSRAVTYGLGLIAVSIGLTLLMQEHTRMQSPGWQTAFHVAGPTFWGLYLLAGGVVMVCAIPFKERQAVGWACIAVSLAWAGRVVAACVALDQPHASGTAPQAMLIVAGAYFMHGALYLGWLQWWYGRWDRMSGRFMRRHP